MITTLAELLVAALLVIGGLFGLVGSYGLIKLKDRMQRLHAPTKATTLGVGTALVALAFEVWLVQGRLAWREALVVIFFFATAPLSALFMAKVHLHRHLDRKSLPNTGTASDWASFAPDAETDPAAKDPAKT
jgi:multicomponent K+:H+ antiporter subunit G